MVRLPCLAALVLVTGCSHDIYLRDGVNDGDTFSLAAIALIDDSPVLQSWVAYSLTRSTCQLQIGGRNPARANSYGCEFTARMHLLEAWEEKRQRLPGLEDRYLDQLLAVRDAGFLDEYTVYFLAADGWQVPAEVDVAAFRQWRRLHLRRHRPVTRIVGYWTFSGRPDP